MTKKRLKFLISRYGKSRKTIAKEVKNFCYSYRAVKDGGGQITSGSFIPNKQVEIGTGRYCSTKCRGSGVNKPIPVFKFIKKLPEGGCWLFTGFRNKDGYWKIGTTPGKSESAHRVMYKIKNGEIPKGRVVMHTCDNPAEHLMLGTVNDNVQDMVNVALSKSDKSKFSIDTINLIRAEYTGRRGQKLQLSKKYNCSPTTITNILNDWN